MTSKLKIWFLAAVLLLSSFGLAAAPLITAQALDQQLNASRSAQSSGKTTLEKLLVVDIRTPEDYANGHIPGAVSAPYGQWRGPAHSPGQLVELAQLTQLVRSLGIDNQTHIIITSTGLDITDFGAAARVYWTLKYLGLEQLSILNGGMHAWQQASLSLSKEQPVITASKYTPQLNKSILASKEEIQTKIQDQSTLLLDARPQNFYMGQTKAPTAKKPGTIKNAVNFSHDQWFEPGTTLFVSADKAKEIAQDLLRQSPAEVISFCNTGHWAATDWFALSEMVGQPNTKLYPASLAEWSQTDDLPMDNVPGRGQQIIYKLKALFGS